MKIIKNTFKVNVVLPKPDLTSWERLFKEITITTEFRPEVNTFIFKCRIPKYVFNGVVDSDNQYLSNPPKPEYVHETRKKKFTQNISSTTLPSLLSTLSSICTDAIDITGRLTAKTEKYIAIRFTQNNNQMKDGFNFADMGMLTSSKFQFFTLYKAIKQKNSMDRYNFKSDKVINGGSLKNKNIKRNGWYWYGIGSIESNFKLIRWTQEREDFLQSVQDKFVDMNVKLESYLGDIDDEKIVSLMNNSQFLLG